MLTQTSALIVVGVNDTPAGRRAVTAGAREAALHHCRLELVHAFNWAPLLARPGEPDPPAAREALLRWAATEARRVAPEVPVRTTSIEGSPVVVLLRRARAAAMTVIGDDALPDGVCLPAEALVVQVAARTAGTVLVTRATPPRAAPVIVGVNGSAASQRALRYAFHAAVTRRVALVVVHVRHHDDDTTPALAQRITALERAFGHPAHVQILDGEPEIALREATRFAGLVVIGARGRHPYSGLLGGVAQTMLHHSPAPVVLVRNLMPCVDRLSRTGPSLDRPVGIVGRSGSHRSAV